MTKKPKETKKREQTIFSEHILAWFDQHGRKDLPWQQNKTPYRVWVSEIMLQQTQVSTVIPYFLRFMEQFPTIQSLANASEDDVLHLWTGLGYYSRARNLHRTAKIITELHHSEFPATQDELEELPGIGQSTAGAILAIAFGTHAAILDGNVKRVLTRFYGIREWPGNKKIHDQLWIYAEQLTPHKRVADYTQAMMDLGATLCIRGKPQCDKCPLSKNCIAFLEGIEKTLPRPKPRKKIPVRQSSLLILQHKNTVLLEKRPPTGIWGGLWSLPELAGTPTVAEIKNYCRQHFQCDITDIQNGESFRHTFSHFHLDISPVTILIKKAAAKIMADGQQIWYNLHDPANVGLPAPVKKLLREKTS